MAGGNRGHDGIKIAVDADFCAFGGDPRPAVSMANGNRGDPDVIFSHIGAVVAGAVPLAQFFHVDDPGFEADGGTKVKNVGAAKLVFGVDAVNGHARADHVEESVGMQKETGAGSGMLFAQGDAFFFERGAGFAEATNLFFIEVGIFGEGHHGALDADGLAGGKIAHERSGLMIRHADAADPRVHANMEPNGLLCFGGDFVERGTEGRVDHRKDVAHDSVGKVLLVEGAEKKDGLANAGVAEGEGFVKLDDGEAKDFRLRFKKLRDVGNAGAIAVVFDDGENGARGNAAGDFGDVVAKVFAMNFDPGIEGGVLRRDGYRRLRRSKLWSRMQDRGQNKASFEKTAARVLHS